MINAFNLLGSGGYLGGDVGNPNFATTLYTGNGSTQSIITGKNNAAGSLTWIKRRDGSASHRLFDAVRGATKYIESNTTQQEITTAATLTAFNSNGFALGSDSNVNASATDFVAWSFLEAAGFFDIVSYTGNGIGNRSIAHNLGVDVGCVIIKNLTSTAGVTSWSVAHRSGNGGTSDWTYNGILNANNPFGNTNPALNSASNSDFVLTGNISPSPSTNQNVTGQSYIAYLFAHNPSQGIACDGFTTDGSGNATVNVGFRPQFLLSKCRTTTGDWHITDKERGAGNYLEANTSNAEASGNPFYTFTGNGFTVSGEGASRSFIYVAIR